VPVFFAYNICFSLMPMLDCFDMIPLYQIHSVLQGIVLFDAV
jgi:hypothetical protein